MIVQRFKTRYKPERLDEVVTSVRKIVAQSRTLEGVISFDVAQDLDDPNSLIAIEVFEDQAAVDRQESLPDVVEFMALFPDLLAAEAEATAFHVSSAESRL
jgi:quinol monooxygenase YgiN